MTANRNKPPETLLNIQILRCFAAMAVVFHHVSERFSTDFHGPFWGFTGMAGVDVFFVISGFIMFHTTQGGDRDVSRFWTDRAIRIVPLYWMALGLVVLLYLSGDHPIDIKRLDLGDAIAAFAFVPDVRADNIAFPMLNVGWTLNFEMYFYLLFGLTFFMRSQAKALAALTCVFVGFAIVRVLTPGLPFVLEFWFRPISLEFAAGGALALAYRSAVVAALSRRQLRLLGATLLMVGTLALLVAGWRVGWRLNLDFDIRLIAFGAPSVLVVAGALLLERGGLAWRNTLLLALGAASYAIYISHQFVIEGLKYITLSIEPRVNVTVDLLFIACGLVLSALAGVAIHRWLEGPMTRRLKSLVAPGRERASKSAGLTPQGADR